MEGIQMKRNYRMKDLPARTGMGKSLIYRDVKNGEFPPGRLIAPNVRIWTEEEIEAELRQLHVVVRPPETGAHTPTQGGGAAG